MTIDLSEKRRRRKNERNAAMYDQDVFDLLQAIDTWRRKNDRSFPAWSEVLQILKSLGWRKTEAPDAVVEAVHPKADAAPVEAKAAEPVEPMPTAKALPSPRSARKS
jgi:ABC-type antimicrobial peptide transport system ATPase subunit